MNRTSLLVQLGVFVEDAFEAVFVFEVLVGADLEFGTGLFVASNNAVGMHLDHAGGPHVADAVLDHVVQCTGFLGSVHENQNLSGVHHGADSYGEGLLGNLGFVVVEEAAVGLDGVGGEGLHTGAGSKAASGLVEGDMAVRTYATHKEIDSACLGDHLLVMVALGLQVGGVAVEDMDVLFLDVDVVEEVIPHEAVVALGMIDGKAYIFVHIEGHYILKREDSFLIELYQVLVEAERGAAGGTSQNKRMICCGIEIEDALSHIVGGP